jgi:hypothetical protein
LIGGIFFGIPGISIFVVISHRPSCRSGTEAAKAATAMVNRIIEVKLSFFTISFSPFSEKYLLFSE